MTVTKETLIGEILDFDVETARFFFEIGMHCLGCPHSRGESIADACQVHGTNADELVAKINEYLPVGIKVTGNAADVKVADIYSSEYTIICETDIAADETLAAMAKEILSGTLEIEKRSKKGTVKTDISDRIYSLDVRAEKGELIVNAVLKDAADGSINPRYLVSALNDRLNGVKVLWADYRREKFFTLAQTEALRG